MVATLLHGRHGLKFYRVKKKAHTVIDSFFFCSNRKKTKNLLNSFFYYYSLILIDFFFSKTVRITLSHCRLIPHITPSSLFYLFIYHNLEIYITLTLISKKTWKSQKSVHHKNAQRRKQAFN